MKLENRKVSTRLAVGFGFLIAAMLAIAGGGLYAISALTGSLHEITVVNNTQQQLALAMRAATLRRAIAVRSVAISRDPAERKAAQAAFVEDGLLYDTLRDRLSDEFRRYASTTEPERALLREVIADQKAIGPRLDELMHDLMSGDPARAHPTLLSELKPMQDVWIPRLTELANLETQLNEVVIAEAQSLSSTLRAMILSVSVAALFLGVAASFLIARSILRQLGGEPVQAQTFARMIAAGDLTHTLQSDGRNPDSLMASLEAMRRQLVGIVTTIQGSAISIADSASQIAEGNVDLSRRTEEQAASLEESAASMEQLTATVRQNNDSSRVGSELARVCADTAREAGVSVAQVVEAMGKIEACFATVAQAVSIVEHVSFQTNLLALNAAVEAARAGEHGRGFAVVAAEVRTLAHRSAQADKEIRQVISESAEVVSHGSALVEQAGLGMQRVVDSVAEVAAISNGVAIASQEQTLGIEQVNVAVTQMDAISQQNAALVEESAAATEELAGHAAQLRQAVSVFRTTPAPGQAGTAQKWVLQPDASNTLVMMPA